MLTTFYYSSKASGASSQHCIAHWKLFPSFIPEEISFLEKAKTSFLGNQYLKTLINGLFYYSDALTEHQECSGATRQRGCAVGANVNGAQAQMHFCNAT